MKSDTPRTDACTLDEREGITHPDLCETYMAYTDYWALRECSRQLERELTAAQAQLAAAQKDAQRYRWLRDHVDMECGVFSFEYDDYGDAGKLDSAIDAAMQAKGEG